MSRLRIVFSIVLITLTLAVEGSVKIEGHIPDYVTITNAVANATDGDVIRCSTGLYFEAVRILSKDITIDGGYDADCVAKEDDYTYLRLPPPGVGASIVAIADAKVTLNDLDLAYASPAGSFELNGAGLRIQNQSNVKLDGCLVYRNAGHGYGGGIYVTNSILSITNTLVYSNVTTTASGLFPAHGGGIAAIDSTVNLYGAGAGDPEDCRLDNNNAELMGGGIYLLRSTCFIDGESADIRYNTATNGGGIAAEERSFVEIQDGADVGGNQAYNYGGGLFLSSSSTGYVHGSQTYIGFNAFLLGANIASNAGGFASGGGIAAINDSRVVIESSARVAHNWADYGGGGIYLSNAYCHIDNASVGYPYNTIHTNTASHGGGILAGYDSYLVLTNNALIHGNRAEHFYGGGLYLLRSDARMDNSTVRNNTANGNRAGGIYMQYASVTARQCAVNNNTCYGGDGGALDAYNSSAVFDDTVFGTNAALNNGGGLCWEGLSSHVLTLTNNCRIQRNTAGHDGGGLWLDGPVMARGCSLYANEATNSGGGIYLTGTYARVTFESCSMEFNEADCDEDAVGDGGAIFMTDGAWLTANSQNALARYDGNRAYRGGVLYAQAASTTLWADASYVLSIDNNRAADDGGAFAIYDSALVITGNTRIYNNSALEDGGGLYVKDSRVELFGGVEVGHDDTNNANRAGNYGGGMAVNGSTVLLESVSFLNNTASNYSGGLDTEDGLLTATNVLFSGNQAQDNNGGAVYANGTRGYMDTTRFVSNTAMSGQGGGVFWERSDLDLVDSSFSDNAAQQGGGLYVQSATTRLHRLTVDGNSATGGYGGGILSTVASMTLNSSLLTDNEAGVGGGIAIVNSKGWMQDNTVTVNRANAGGGGMGVLDSELYATNLFVRGNDADSDGDSSGNGGGMLISDFSLAMLYGTNGSILVSSNHAVRGGGIALSDSEMQINNNGWLEGNVASDRGGAIYVGTKSTGMVMGAYILRNDAIQLGGGIMVITNSGLYLENVLLAENVVDVLGSGGGVYVYNGTAWIFASTLISNAVSGVECAVSGGSSLNMNGCIVRGSPLNISAGHTVEYCCVEGGYTGTDNFDEEPLLYHGNYHLTAWSPCRDRGQDGLMDEHDIDNELRTGKMDVGFDEYVDSDNDRLPDIVETDTGIWNGDLDMGTDPNDDDTDNDGVLDGDEWMADTDPNNPSSVFQINHVGISGAGAFSTAWSGGTNVWQYFEIARDFTQTNGSPSWQIYSTYPPPTAPGITNNQSFRTNAVFRVRATRFP